ncbi:MAG: NAD(P)H-dependent oxidoreductase subunit E [Bacteroidota bacterium]|nr:NAD(P)H-dependent oxidoreductase subunit E [Bacteroidota bacterium]
MEEKTLNITICLGSSCFSKGSKDIVETVQEHLEDINMKEKTNFKGGHCFGNCAEGPIMIVNGKTFKSVNPESAIIAINSMLDAAK